LPVCETGAPRAWGTRRGSLRPVIVKAEESRPARWGCAHGACGVWAPPGPAGRDVPWRSADRPWARMGVPRDGVEGDPGLV